MRFAPVGNIAVDLGKVLADLGDDLAVRGCSSELVDKQPRVAAHDAAQISILGQGRGATRMPNVRTLTLATVIALLIVESANAQVTVLTSRQGTDIIDWRQINVVPNNLFPTPLSFESFAGIDGEAGQKGDLFYL